MSQRTHVRVGERELSLGNLDKVLYPATATTKAEVIEYYARQGRLVRVNGDQPPEKVAAEIESNLASH